MFTNVSLCFHILNSIVYLSHLDERETHVELVQTLLIILNPETPKFCSCSCSCCLHFPGSLPGDVGETVAVGGIGHQPDPGVVAALLEHLAQDDHLQLEHGDGLVHHRLQQHTVGQQDLVIGGYNLSWQRRPTSRLILSPDFLLVGSFM